MGLRAALFDVGDTLVEHWAPPERLRPLIRGALVGRFGERDWYDALIAADLEPKDPADPHRQETNRWYAQWFAEREIACDLEIDQLRAAFAVPIDLVSTPVPGAAAAVRWCKAHGLAVLLVTNTLSRGDKEVLRDWDRMGLAAAIDGVVTSHDVGWRKPHPAMFARALALAETGAAEAVMVGDSLEADVKGARALGIRAVWRRRNGAPGLDEAHADAVVGDLTELPGVIGPWL